VVVDDADSILPASTLCPDAFACAVECEGTDACGDARVNCGVGTCTMVCGVDAAACEGAVMQCGPEACTATCAGSVAPDQLGCDGSCGCATCE
jgi:hypothetical protein